MKRIVMVAVLLGLVALAVFAGACGGTTVPTGAIAVVGDQTVTQAQFDEIWAQAKAQYAATRPGAPRVPQGGHGRVQGAQGEHRDLPRADGLMIAGSRRTMKVSVSDKEHGRPHHADHRAGGRPEEARQAARAAGRQHWTSSSPSSRRRCCRRRSRPRWTPGRHGQRSRGSRSTSRTRPTRSQFVVPDPVTARHVLVKTEAEAQKVKALLEAEQHRRGLGEDRGDSTPPIRARRAVAVDLGSFDQVAHGDAVRLRCLRAQGQRHLRPGQDPVRLARHRGDRQDPGQQPDASNKAKAGLIESAQVAGAAQLDGVAQATPKKTPGIIYAAGFDPLRSRPPPSPPPSQPRALVERRCDPAQTTRGPPRP